MKDESVTIQLESSFHLLFHPYGLHPFCSTAFQFAAHPLARVLPFRLRAL